MKKIYLKNFFNFSNHIKTKRKKYTFIEIDNYITAIHNMHLDLDSLPDDLYEYKEDIYKILHLPGVKKSNECCDSGCINCVLNIDEDDINKYNHIVNNLLDRINNRI